MTDDNSPTASPAARPAATASTPDADLLNALDDYTIPLDSTVPTTPLDDVAQLNDRLADARVLGLGEATHGTREFFQLKHRFVQYLVTELDCRAFALEANFSEALALDDYVVHGEGDPRDALDAIYFWTWNVESVLALVEWLREFNATRPLDDRVRFYGIDAQYTQGAVDALREFFDDADLDFLETTSEALTVAGDDGTPAQRNDDAQQRVDTIDDLVPRLRDRLDERGAAYASTTDDATVTLARQHVRVLEQAAAFKRGFIGEDAFDDPDAVGERIRVRDRAMADNVDWILGHEDADRLALWAHDAHLNRAGQNPRDVEVTAPSLGSCLADRHGADYYALGFAFGRGSFQALSDESGADDEDPDYELGERTLDAPLPGTVGETFTELGHAVSVTDLRSASDDDRLADWLAAEQQGFSIGSMFDEDDPESFLTPYTLGDAFDALCYVAETTRARPLDDE
jgi:erythromycin esterase